MVWATLFSATNAIALVAWALLILGARGPKTASAILYLGVGLLCLTYVVALGLILGGVVDPGKLPGSGTTSFSTIEGIRSIFMSDAGVVIGWTHYLAFDLFVGQWIAKDADNKGFARWLQAPILVLTLFAGPAGFLLWLIARERRARRHDRPA
ncbi:ABA4-like family protein [Sphingomonas sp. LY29]|uniref:ABA4-like family protein n=1 Tax=Sphingomonas sp. LY29 TaxID=3095341 RepID=UPI002D778248|nr:ABA4-like family protein [Sphingomonas sp. LY29]WRP25851.1 ABA4-like family protein [Sphingomonas sp. LY29]